MEIENPFLDRNSDILISSRNLPHWNQFEKFQYITFHTADAIPQKEIKYLLNLKKGFEKINPKPWDKETENRYHKLISSRKENLLDKGVGRCILKYPEYRKIVEDSIIFYHLEKYFILSYVIMPNHVHLLVKTIGNSKIYKTIGSLMRFSARKINEKLKTKGSFWTEEAFDRIVRSEEHLKHCLHYIHNNPKNLKAGEYTLV